MQRILVTGGCGFIGSNFIRHMLTTDPHVVIVNLDKLTYAGNPENLSDLETDQRYQFIHGYQNNTDETIFLQVMLGKSTKTELLAYADDKLYEAKRSGRNRTCL